MEKVANITSAANWTNLGTNSSTGGYAGIGRINCIAFHPTDVNTYWVGSPSGGLWKTIDNGSTWTCLNNNMPVIGVSDIAIPSDYATSNTMYVVTGDRDGGSLSSLGTGMRADNNSLGIYKSIDGGSSWVATGLAKLNTDNKIIGRLILASNNTTLYASVYLDGIYKSIDSRTSWTKIAHLPCTFVIDMEFKPGDDNTIYASTKSIYSNTETFIYRTSDAGATWSGTSSTWSSINRVFMGAVGSGRIELAVSPVDPTVVYAVYSQPSKLHSILKSSDSGLTFTQIWDGQVANHNLLGYNVDGNDLSSGQGEYDLCIAVSPTDANIVFVGGVNTWMTSDGGTTWKIKTHWSSNGTIPNRYRVVHADKHAMEFQSADVLFEGNDGGVYRAQLTNNDWLDAGSDFVDKTNGLVISQLYRLGVSKSDVTKVITGLQDNGTKLYNNGLWKDVHGGDGMECLIDHTNPLYMYSTYITGQIYRNSNGYSTFAETQISANIPGGQPSGAWVTPYIMNPSNSQVIIAGYDKVWKTTDRGDTWTALSGVLSGTNKLRSLAIAPSDENVIYAADFTHIWKTTDASAGSPTWTEITGTLPVASANLTYIAVNANDPSTLWVVFGSFSSGNKVFQSIDGGSTWTNITGTLPNVPVLCIVQETRVIGNPRLFIGTDVGVYEKNGSADWEYFNTGLPSVVVTELDFYYGATQSADRLRAATYGRGLWETSIESTVTKFIVTSSDYNPVAGSSVTITAQLADAANNSVANPGITVNWTKNNANGSFSNASSITDATGKATITFTTHTVAGTVTTVTANDGSRNGTSSNITTIAGAVAKYIVAASDYNPTAGSSVNVTAQLSDNNNNPVTTPGITVNWSKSDPNGSFSSLNSTTNASGIASTIFTTHTSGGVVCTVTANDGTQSGTSATITTVAAVAGITSFTVLSPLNGSVGQSITPLFSGSTTGLISNSTQLIISTTSTFNLGTTITYTSTTSPALIQPGGVGTTLSLQLDAQSMLSNGTTYYWKVVDGAFTSSTYSFMTIISAMAYLTNPYNGSIISGNATTFSWYSLTQGLQYTLQISKDNSFNSFVDGYSTLNFTPSNYTSNYAVISNSIFTQGVTYYWRVITKTLSGVVINFSNTWQFSMPGLPQVIATYPTGNVSIYNNPPTLYWYSLGYNPKVTEYLVRYHREGSAYPGVGNLGDAETAAQGFFSTTNINWFTTIPFALTGGEKYYWQVASYDGVTAIASLTFSPEETFTIYGNSSFVVCYPSWPTGGASVYSTTPTLYWYSNVYSPIIYYKIQIDDNSDFSSNYRR